MRRLLGFFGRLFHLAEDADFFGTILGWLGLHPRQIAMGIVASVLLAIWEVYSGATWPEVILYGLAALAIILAILVLGSFLWERRTHHMPKSMPSVPLNSISQNSLAHQVANLRVADDPAVVSLFDGDEGDRLLSLIEADEIITWARPMGQGEPPLTKLSGDQWKAFSFRYMPKLNEQTKNQTFVKSKVNNDTFYYDVYLNRHQIEQAWPVISDVWKPCHLAIQYIGERIGDKDSKNCFPDARRGLRQAAYNKRVAVRGKKQLSDRRMIREGEYSDIHTDIDSDYWINSEINALATSADSRTQTMYHTDPQTASAWGPKGLDERNRYAELLVNWPQILREWPKS